MRMSAHTNACVRTQTYPALAHARAKDTNPRTRALTRAHAHTCAQIKHMRVLPLTYPRACVPANSVAVAYEVHAHITCAWNVRRPPELVFALAQPDDAQPDDAIAHVRLRGVTGASARSRAGTL